MPEALGFLFLFFLLFRDPSWSSAAFSLSVGCLFFCNANLKVSP